MLNDFYIVYYRFLVTTPFTLSLSLSLSFPAHSLCCVCFSELLKRQKTKSREKRKGERDRASVQSFLLFPPRFSCFHFLFSSSISSFSSADLANGLIELLSFYSVVFYLFPPALLLRPSSVFFDFIQSDFCFVLRVRRKPSFHCPDLIFFVRDTHTGLGNCGGQ